VFDKTIGTALVQFVEASGVTLSALSVMLVLVLLSSCGQAGCFCLHFVQLGNFSHFFSFAI